jgi:hypothetical protein
VVLRLLVRSDLDKPLQSEDQQLVLKTAENLQKKQQLLLKQKQRLDDRIVKMGKGSKKK